MNDIEQLGRHVAALQDHDLAALGSADEARDRFLSALPRRQKPSTFVVRLAAAAVLIGTCVGVVVVRRQPSLLASVDGAPLGDVRGRRIEAPRDADLPVSFSDGSRLQLKAGGSVVVTALRDNGAEATLEQGRVNVEVVHRDTTRWELHAGPYQVHVVGTRFDLRWAPADKRLVLRLREGKVVVTGGSLASPLPIESGQVLTATSETWNLGPEADFADRGEAALPVVPSPSTIAPPPVDPGEKAPPVVEGSAPPSLTPPTVRSTWQDLARSGKYDAAFDQAEREGFPDICRRSSARDLMALSEAARFAKKTSRSREALLALRERFPGDNLAPLAAFMLGRISGPREAASWFRSYLQEAKDGSLTREASGRLLEALYRSGQTTEARDAANRYLKQYPHGPHAALAERVLAP